MDSQSVKTVEESGGIRGFDGGKLVKGRKRHLLVDTLGLPIAWYVTPADLSDSQGVRRLLSGLAYFVPRLKKIWADAAYRGKELADWCLQQGDGWELEIVEREPGTRGFHLLPRRWAVERSLAWISRNRRLAKDYERMVQTSETLIELAPAVSCCAGWRLSVGNGHRSCSPVVLAGRRRPAPRHLSSSPHENSQASALTRRPRPAILVLSSYHYRISSGQRGVGGA